MSRRAYNHRVEVLDSNVYRVGRLARLNRDLDGLYELMYAQWRTVTEEDYKVFGAHFQLLLETIKGLYDACRKAPKEMGLKEETKRLGMNYSALYEVNSDIVNFCIKAPKSEVLKAAFAHLDEVDGYVDASHSRPRKRCSPEHKRCRGLQCQKKSPYLHHSSFSALDFPGVIDSYPAVGEPKFAEHFSSDEVMAEPSDRFARSPGRKIGTQSGV